MKYKVVVHRRAVRFVKSLPDDQKQRIKQFLCEMESGVAASMDVKPMAGEWKGYYRVRLGRWRVIFWVDDSLRTIYVDHVGARGDIYKKGRK